MKDSFSTSYRIHLMAKKDDLCMVKSSRVGYTYETDILISGAGPGGVTTALHLANNGIPCTLVDKAHFPRDKVCGDALSGKVVEVLQQVSDDFIEDFAEEPVQLGSWGVSFFAPNRRELSVPFKLSYNPQEELPPGYIARRTDFDDLLLRRAKERPEIQVIEGVNLTQFERTKSGIRGYAKDGRYHIHTRLFIAADGAQSPFARKMADHKTEPAHNCAGLRAYYKGVTDLRSDNFIELHFLKESLPGYFWIFPLPNGYANVGIGMRSDKVSKQKVNLKSLLHEVVRHSSLSSRFQNARMDGHIKGFGLPLGSRKRALSGDHYMLVGDAGSLIDPFTGEGIGNAMISGMYAAEYAIAARSKNDYSASTLSAYDEAVYSHLWKELRLSKTLQELVRFPWLFNFVVNRARHNKKLRDTISCMFEDIDMRDKFRSPSFYFQLLFAGS